MGNNLQFSCFLIKELYVSFVSFGYCNRSVNDILASESESIPSIYRVLNV